MQETVIEEFGCEELSIDYFAPTKTTLSRAEGLNVLLVASNRSLTVRAGTIIIYGDDGARVLPLCRKDATIPAQSHLHLYCNIPAGSFSESRWGARLEECRLFASACAPCGGELDELLFFCD